MLPRGNPSYPRLFQTAFALKRTKADHLRRTAATAERNQLIIQRYQAGHSISIIAQDTGLSVQRIFQIVNERHK